MFIDSLLIDYQTNNKIQFEIERNPITCTPFRRDILFGKLKLIEISYKFYFHLHRIWIGICYYNFDFN